jgi:hypothetical protein
VISPRSREPVPRPFGLYFRPASRMALLGLCLSAVLCLARSAVAAGGISSAENKREKPYAVIFGTVWGPDDHPPYRVRIKIRREDEKKARWELYSDHNGEFAQRVPAGKQDYVVWADLKDRKSGNGNQSQGEEVKVHVDADERVDTGLHLK